MGLLGRSLEGHGMMRGAFNVATRVARPIVVGVRPMLEPWFGMPLDKQGVWTLEAKEPEVKAKLAAAAIAESQKGEGDPQLLDIGVALAVTALTDLDKPGAPIPPPEVPEVVTGVIESMLPGVGAEDRSAALAEIITNSPRLSSDTAVAANEILREVHVRPEFP